MLQPIQSTHAFMQPHQHHHQVPHQVKVHEDGVSASTPKLVGLSSGLLNHLGLPQIFSDVHSTRFRVIGPAILRPSQDGKDFGAIVLLLVPTELDSMQTQTRAGNNVDPNTAITSFSVALNKITETAKRMKYPSIEFISSGFRYLTIAKLRSEDAINSADPILEALENVREEILTNERLTLTMDRIDIITQQPYESESKRLSVTLKGAPKADIASQRNSSDKTNAKSDATANANHTSLASFAAVGAATRASSYPFDMLMQQQQFPHALQAHTLQSGSLMFQQQQSHPMQPQLQTSIGGLSLGPNSELVFQNELRQMILSPQPQSKHGLNDGLSHLMPFAGNQFGNTNAWLLWLEMARQQRRGSISSRSGTTITAVFSSEGSTVESKETSTGTSTVTNSSILARVIALVRSRIDSIVPNVYIWLPLDESLSSMQLARLTLRPFPSPFGTGFSLDGWSWMSMVQREPISRRELRMMQVMAAIREKPEWYEKVERALLREKWTKELVPSRNSTSVPPPITSNTLLQSQGQQFSETSVGAVMASLHQPMQHPQQQLMQQMPAYQMPFDWMTLQPHPTALQLPVQNSSTSVNSSLLANTMVPQMTFPGFTPMQQSLQQAFIPQEEEPFNLLSVRAMSYIWQELRFWAKRFKADLASKRAPIQPSAIDGVWQCDSLIPKSIQEQFEQALSRLESSRLARGIEPDVHPGSNGQVINVIHPSLHCLRIGKEGSRYTRSPIPRIGSITSIGLGLAQEPSEADSNPNLASSMNQQRSKRFAWLPTDVGLQQGLNGDDVPQAKFLGYINSLHPELSPESDLYQPLEQILARFIPMWELVLAQLTNHQEAESSETETKSLSPNAETRPSTYGRVRQSDFGYSSQLSPDWKRQLEADAAELKKEKEDELSTTTSSLPQPDSPILSGATIVSPIPTPLLNPQASITAFARGQQDRTTRCTEETLEEPIPPYAQSRWKQFDVNMPFRPPCFLPPIGTSLNRLIDIGRLQVITKLSTIVLTPENPTYPGGAWHIEGMENERIVASGIYYFSQSNITESRLAFRTAVSTDNLTNGEDQTEDDFEETGERMREIYDLEDNGVMNQLLGSVRTREGRCLAWPNILQHQVEPFSLTDKTQSGHRRILVFFLVDPTMTIPSTSIIPPQSRQWMMDAIDLVRKNMLELTSLPEVLIGMSLDYLFPTQDESNEDSLLRVKSAQHAALQVQVDDYLAKNAIFQTANQQDQIVQAALSQAVHQLHSRISHRQTAMAQVSQLINDARQKQELLLPGAIIPSADSSSSTTMNGGTGGLPYHPGMGFQLQSSSSPIPQISAKQQQQAQETIVQAVQTALQQQGATEPFNLPPPEMSIPLNVNYMDGLMATQLPSIDQFQPLATVLSSNSSSTSSNVPQLPSPPSLHTISHGAAIVSRLELMKERKYFVTYETNSVFQQRLHRERPYRFANTKKSTPNMSCLSCWRLPFKRPFCIF